MRPQRKQSPTHSYSYSRAVPFHSVLFRSDPIIVVSLTWRLLSCMYLSACRSVGCEKLVLPACIKLKLESDPLVTHMLLRRSSVIVVAAAAAASDTKLNHVKFSCVRIEPALPRRRRLRHLCHHQHQLSMCCYKFVVPKKYNDNNYNR